MNYKGLLAAVFFLGAIVVANAADTFYNRFNSDTNTKVQIKLVDNGDGTFSEGAATLSGSPTVIDQAGNDTPSESFANVTTVVSVMAASATRESHIICNEGPEIARCGSGSVTTTTGKRLLVDTCYSLDSAKPYRGAISCISVGGPSTKITVAQSN